MCLAKNIRYLRKKKNLSQDYIAEKLGYKSYTTIQKWEMGVSEPSIAKLRKLAELFGVEINDMTSIDLEKAEKDGVNKYYTDPETARMAQEMFEDPEMRSLYHMKRNMTPERFKRQMDQFKDMYRLEHPEDSDFGC